MDSSSLANFINTQNICQSSQLKITIAAVQITPQLIEESNRQRKKSAHREKRARKANIPRDFEGGYRRLMQDYFGETPI